MFRYLLFIILTSVTIQATQTIVTYDTVKVNSTWSDTIILTKKVTVPSRVTLTILPGTVISAKTAGSLFIRGSLFAKGTQTDSIIFKSFDATGWEGLRFQENVIEDLSVLQFADVTSVTKTGLEGGALNLNHYYNLTASNCHFYGNRNAYGGAIAIITSSMTAEQCLFDNNSSPRSGGAIYSEGSFTAINCIFTENSSVEDGSVLSGSASLINCLVYKNTSGSGYGCITGRNLQIINCTVYNNKASSCGFGLGNATIINSLFWKNSLSDSIFQFALTTITIKNSSFRSDPMFSDTAVHDFSLRAESHCRDAGMFDTAALKLPVNDLNNKTRIRCGIIDIGAFEFQPPGNCPPRIQDTTLSLLRLYNKPLIIDTSLFRIFDYDNDPHFVIAEGSGYSIRKDTVFIDSGFTDTIRVKVRVTDGMDTSRTSALIKIKPEYPPVILSLTSRSIHQGTSFVFSDTLVKAVDLDKQRITVIVHEGDGYTLNGKTITPESQFTGDLQIPVHVTDGKYSSDTLFMVLHVFKNSVPVISQITPQRIRQEGSLTVTMNMLTVSDPDGDSLKIVLSPGTGYTITGSVVKPDVSYYGILSIPVRVTDGFDTSEAKLLTCTVDKINHAPVIKEIAGQVIIGCQQEIPITMDMISVTDPDGDSLQLKLFPGTGYTVNGYRIIPDSCQGTINVQLSFSDGTKMAPTATLPVTFIKPQIDSLIPADSRPLPLNGKLTVKNGLLCNQYGYPVQLKGMSSHGLQWFGGYMNQKSVEWLVTNWKISVIRAAMYTSQSGYISDRKYKQKVKEIAAFAEISGIYCIIDWHILSDGDPNVYKNEALSFFSEMAQLYKDKKHILYEICNEPNGKAVTWDNQVKPYAEEIINAIRKYDRDAVILVGSSTWSQDVDVVAQNRLSYDNIAYTLHFYAGTHGDTLLNKARTALDSGLALFVSEWGTSLATGSGGVYINYSDKWLRFLDSAGISWCNWSLSAQSESSAALKYKADSLGGWPDSMLSESGLYIRSRIRADMINDPPILHPVKTDTVKSGNKITRRFTVSDPDQYQKISWKLTNQPKGMNIDSTGLLTWDNAVTGIQDILVTATDDSGAASSVHYSLRVEPPVKVNNKFQECRLLKTVKSKNEIIFMITPGNSKAYSIRIYSVSGRVIKEIKKTANRKSNGIFSEQVKTKIEAAGLYLLEFSSTDINGSVKKMTSTLICN